MTFLHPGFLYAAGGAAVAVVALHFLVADQPRAGILPTVRFFPDVRVRATALTVRLSDLPLLGLRLAILALIGATFAQPQLSRSRSAILRIVAVDASGAVGRPAEAADSARNHLSGAASVILFDSAATEVAPGTIAKSGQPARSDAAGSRRGSLSSALIVALRAASRMRAQADSLELVLVSPLLAEEADSATAAIRALWPGRINVVRVSAAPDRPAPRTVTLEWADSSAAPRWTAREHPDTIGGVRFAGGMLVHPFARKWRLTRVDSAERVVARWVDGEAAIVERRIPSGCLRSISVTMPSEGDAILRPSFQKFFATMGAPCAESRSGIPLSPAFVAMLEGEGHLAPTGAIAPEAARMTPLVPWLLAAAFVLGLVEILERARRERSGARRDESAAADLTGERPARKTA